MIPGFGLRLISFRAYPFLTLAYSDVFIYNGIDKTLKETLEKLQSGKLEISAVDLVAQVQEFLRPIFRSVLIRFGTGRLVNH